MGHCNSTNELDLKAESGWNYELVGKRKITDNDLLKLNIFHMDIDDRIYRAKDSTSGLNIYKMQKISQHRCGIGP